MMPRFYEHQGCVGKTTGAVAAGQQDDAMMTNSDCDPVCVWEGLPCIRSMQVVGPLPSRKAGEFRATLWLN